MKYADYVDYSKLDPFKQRIMKMLESTFKNIERLGIRVVPESIGEPATLFDFIDYDFMLAFKTDGVGTKNKVADKMNLSEKVNGTRHYTGFGQDLIAMNANDIICLNAIPFALTDEIASGASEWFSDEKRINELIQGLVDGCDEAGMTIPCGETPTLPGIILPESANMTGSSIGIVKPKEKAIFGQKLQEGDIIYGLPSSGIHSNGLSLARAIAEKLPLGYSTKIGDRTLGELLLTPTRIYVKQVLELSDKIDIHYMSNITGSAFRKIMRAKKIFTYLVENLPEPQEIFRFLQEKGSVSDYEAYQTWNMGVGFVIFSTKDAKSEIEKVGGFQLGRVEKGDKRVLIKPKNIEYKEE